MALLSSLVSCWAALMMMVLMVECADEGLMEIAQPAAVCTVAQEFPCYDSGKTCLHQRLWCDGVINCPETGIDEMNCTHHSKAFQHFAANLPDSNNRPQLDECHMDQYPEECLCIYRTTVNCSDSGLLNVPADIQPQDSLKKLLLAHNQISFLPNGAFLHYATNLTVIDLSFNRLSVIEADAFNGLLKLRFLHLSDNKLTVIQPYTFSNVPKLEMLYMSDNRLVDWEPEAFMENYNLYWLDVRKNRLQLQKDNMLPNVATHCSLKCHLELDHNNITTITRKTFANFSSFYLLSLADNKISKVDEDVFSHLTLYGLIIRNNQIEVFPPQLLAGQNQLVDLDMGHNPTRYLAENFLDGLSSLRLLNLSGLTILNISSRMFGSNSLAINHIQFSKMYYCGFASHIKDCFPRHDGISSTKNLLDNPALRIFSWFIAILAISFNLFVFFARCYLWQGSSELHKVQSLCITALAVADLIMGLYMLIISVTDQIYKGRYHLYSHLWSRSLLCRFSGLMAVISSEVSALLLVFMALERYTLLVWNPFHRSEASIRNTMTWIAGCWILGGAVALFPLLLNYGNDDAGFQPFYGQNGVCLPLYIHEPYMDQGWIYSLITFVIVPCTASVTTIGLYCAIFNHLKKSRPQAYRSRSECCYLRKVLVITISNNISWATIIVTKILALALVSTPGEVYAFMAIFILPVNCCLNPLIYTLMTPKFKSFWSSPRWCPFFEFSKSRAEAAALRRAVTYPTGINGLGSRYSSYRVPLQRSNGSSTTLSSRYTVTNSNGQSATFSRQNSQIQLTARFRKDPVQRRRSSPVTNWQAPLLAPPLATLPTIRSMKSDPDVEEINYSVPILDNGQQAETDPDEFEDEGIVVLNTSSAEEPPTGSPRWDC